MVLQHPCALAFPCSGRYAELRGCTPHTTPAPYSCDNVVEGESSWLIRCIYLICI